MEMSAEERERALALLCPDRKMRRQGDKARAENFGEWLKDRRLESANECAISMGKHRDWWDAVELGEYLPTEAEVEQMAAAIRVNPVEALEAAGYVAGAAVADRELAVTESCRGGSECQYRRLL